MYPSVMIVDDEPSILQSLSGILSDEGFEIFTASNGYEALKRIEQEAPDLVLLDIWMPGLDGIETLKEIKKKQSGNSGHHHYRTWHHRNRRKCYQIGGI
ncbi:MAG: response regulator [Pseudomonadota bacterium]